MNDNLNEMFSRNLTSWSVSKALLEDYSEVIAKIENVDSKIVYDRVVEKAKIYFEEEKSSIIDKE